MSVWQRPLDDRQLRTAKVFESEDRLEGLVERWHVANVGLPINPDYSLGL